MATPSAIIDALAIVPALIPWGRDLRFVRVLRLLRLLKLGRYSEGMRILVRVFQAKKDELVMSLVIVLVALVMASSFMYYAEHEAQPETFSSIPAAMWWGIVTLTTIGYGDAVPVTQAGQLIGSLSALAGILALALPVGILASGFTHELENRRKRATNCPHCGEEIPPK
jgi:voltage-gated potassium channel